MLGLVLHCNGIFVVSPETIVIIITANIYGVLTMCLLLPFIAHTLTHTHTDISATDSLVVASLGWQRVSS